MSVSATEGVTSPFTTTSGTSGSTDAVNSLGDQNTFLQLMVAQMKYQDPMNPTDSSQFLSQTAQFTSLEKMTTLADQMSSLLQSQMAFGAGGMIGKTAAWTDSDGTTKSGTVTGALLSGPCAGTRTRARRRTRRPSRCPGRSTGRSSWSGR